MPWLGASPRRTLRGMTVRNTFSLKNRELRSPPAGPRFVRSSYIVSSTPSMSSAGLSARAHAAHRADEIGEAFEREVLAVQRNQHGVGGDERVEREQPERRRAVDEDVVVLVAHRVRAAGAAALRAAAASPSRFRRRSGCGRRDQPTIAWSRVCRMNGVASVVGSTVVRAS